MFPALLEGVKLTPVGGGDAHPSVMACSWYMKLCSSVLPGSAPGPDSWNVAYGEMSSDVSGISMSDTMVPASLTPQISSLQFL
jgi:hypothetical protein